MRQIFYTLALVLFFMNYSFSENTKNSSIKDKDICGYGTCSFIKKDLGDGLIIEGQFNSNWDGKGTIELNSNGINSKYSGYIKQMKPHGEGIFTWTNGDMYNGHWIEGKKNGFGMFKDKYGLYVGNWKDGKQHGQGTYTTPAGRKYVGEWKEGKYDGQGTETLSNGWKYVGDWRAGKPWNIKIYGKTGIIIMEYVNGLEQK